MNTGELLDYSVIVFPIIIAVASVYVSIKLSRNESHNLWWYGIAAMGFLTAMLAFFQQSHARGLQDREHRDQTEFREKLLIDNATLRGQLLQIGSDIREGRPVAAPALPPRSPATKPVSLRERLIDTSAQIQGCMAAQVGNEPPPLNSNRQEPMDQQQEQYRKYILSANSVCAERYAAQAVKLRDEIAERSISDKELDDSIEFLNHPEFGGMSKIGKRLEAIAGRMPR